MLRSALAVQGVPIRLTEERWAHICTAHPDVKLTIGEVLAIVAQPDWVVEGPQGELLAVKAVSRGKWQIVVYRIMGGGGFIVTSFSTRRRSVFERWRQVWP